MTLVVGILVALTAIAGAVRMAQTRGVPAVPLLAWSLLLAAVVSAIYVAGALAAFRWVSNRTAQLVLVLASALLAVAVGIWLSRLIWQRLQARSRGSSGNSEA